MMAKEGLQLTGTKLILGGSVPSFAEDRLCAMSLMDLIVPFLTTVRQSHILDTYSHESNQELE